MDKRRQLKDLFFVGAIVLILLLGVSLPVPSSPENVPDEVVSFGVGIPPSVFRALRVETTLDVDGDTEIGGELSVDEINGGYIDFDIESGDPGYQQGRMYWDTNDETVAVHVNNGTDQVTLQLGQEQHVLVRNDTGSDWPNGAIGIATGSVGYRPTAILAQADVITTGVATTYGLVRGVDTSDWDEGDVLYVSATTAGELTNVPPTSGYNVVFGRVLRKHPEDGIIFVLPREAPYRGNLAGGDYVDWDYRGQMTAYGDARWWDDIRVPAQATRLNPATTKPDFGTFISNTKTFLFDPASEESVHFSVQMPHGWVLSTNIEPHVHWTPTSSNTGTVVWGLECTTGAISGTFGVPDILTVAQAANGTAYYHHYADFDELDMSSVDTVSAMLICRLFRDADAGPDTYTGDAALLETDFHYLMDTLGSREETSK